MALTIKGSPAQAHWEANISHTFNYVIPADTLHIYYLDLLTGEFARSSGTYTVTLTTPNGLTQTRSFYAWGGTTTGYIYFAFGFNYYHPEAPTGIDAEILAARGSSINLTITMGPTCPTAINFVGATGFDTLLSQIWNDGGYTPPALARNNAGDEMDMAQDHASGLITIIRSVAA